MTSESTNIAVPMARSLNCSGSQPERANDSPTSHNTILQVPAMYRRYKQESYTELTFDYCTTARISKAYCTIVQY